MKARFLKQPLVDRYVIDVVLQPGPDIERRFTVCYNV
jgi:hypothetical protein